MGECGCGMNRPRYRFPGPGAAIYTLEVYLGCDDCETPIGIVIALHSAKELKSDHFEVKRLPEMPMNTRGDSPECAVPILSALELRKSVAKWLRGTELGEDEIAAETYAEELVDECLPEALEKTRADDE